MAATTYPAQRRNLWPWLTLGGVALATVILLGLQGRLWICACGRIDIWTSEANGTNTSQHLLDPYSFTHVLHGLAFYWALTWALPRVTFDWRLTLAVAIESLWEIVENSAFVIERYRTATAARGYEGDTIVNVVGDLLCCIAGVFIARRLGFRRTLALFLVTEIVLVLLIRDSLLLNILMLLAPVDAIKDWQSGQ